MVVNNEDEEEGCPCGDYPHCKRFDETPIVIPKESPQKEVGLLWPTPSDSL